MLSRNLSHVPKANWAGTLYTLDWMEAVSSLLKNLLNIVEEKGITHEKTNLDMPQQNGVAKHKN